jgi:hypothetical protein
MPVTISTKNGPVSLYPMWEDFKKGIDIQRGPYVEQSYVITSWDETDAVINALMGSTSTAGSSTIHVPGFPCPTSPNLTCMDAYVQGEGEVNTHDGGPVRFNLPKIRATFGIRSWEQAASEDPQQFNSFVGNPGGPTTYAIHSMDYSHEAVKLPNSAYSFGSPPNLPADLPIVKVVGLCTLNVELKKVPYLPSITIMGLVGKVNNDLFLGAPKGQLLFLGARTSKEFESDGTRVQNVAYTFRFREQPWNFFLRPDTGEWDFVQTKTGGKKPYENKDFTPLIVLAGFAGMGPLPVIES